jgi:hypothetical protein
MSELGIFDVRDDGDDRLMIEGCECMKMDGWKMDGLIVERVANARELCLI